MLPAPGLTWVADLRVQVAEPIALPVPDGTWRRMVPITGGTASFADHPTGSVLTGSVLSGGADWQLVTGDGSTELTARYAIELTDGHRVLVTNTGRRSAPPETAMALLRGEPVDPALVYFRTTADLVSDHPALAYLRKRIVLGAGVRQPDAVLITFYAVD